MSCSCPNRTESRDFKRCSATTSRLPTVTSAGISIWSTVARTFFFENRKARNKPECRRVVGRDARQGPSRLGWATRAALRSGESRTRQGESRVRGDSPRPCQGAHPRRAESVGIALAADRERLLGATQEGRNRRWRAHVEVGGRRPRNALTRIEASPVAYHFGAFRRRGLVSLSSFRPA